MNRRAFLAGLTATAAGLLVPERKVWALDQTMIPRPFDHGAGPWIGDYPWRISFDPGFPDSMVYWGLNRALATAVVLQTDDGRRFQYNLHPGESFVVPEDATLLRWGPAI